MNKVEKFLVDENFPSKTRKNRKFRKGNSFKKHSFIAIYSNRSEKQRIKKEKNKKLRRLNKVERNKDYEQIKSVGKAYKKLKKGLENGYLNNIRLSRQDWQSDEDWYRLVCK